MDTCANIKSSMFLQYAYTGHFARNVQILGQGFKTGSLMAFQRLMVIYMGILCVNSCHQVIH